MNNIQIIIRLALAIVIGGAIGYERESQHRPAGFRTHILVCLGATVASMIQLNIVYDTGRIISENPLLSNHLSTDLSRIGAQVITGIGFLGAGTIIHEKGSIKGLTTAASIWMVACIGLAIGLGYYFMSIAATVSVAVVLLLFKRLEEFFIEKRNIMNIEITYKSELNIMDSLILYFETNGIKVKNVDLWQDDSEQEKLKICTYEIVVSYRKKGQIIDYVSKITGVVNVKMS